VRLRWVAPVLFVIAVIAGAFAVTQIESLRDGVLVLAVGLALAAVTGALAITTERRRRAMRETERFFALSPEMVICAGFDGYWKRVNPAVEVVLGYSGAEALGLPFMELIHPDDRERSEEEAARVMGGATALAFENRMLCKDGTYKWIEWTATPVPEERVMYTIGRDVTERRRSESEESALRRLATLIAEGLPPAEIFSAVSEEVGRLFSSDLTVLARFDADGPASVVMGVAKDVTGMPVGSRWELEDGLAAARVYRTGRSARIDAVEWSDLNTPIGALARRVGVVSTVSCPIHVEGRLWGTITVPAGKPLPPDTEERLEKFSQVVATAIANADSREAVARLADEQAALRRVATLVAQDVPASELFGAVAHEVGALFGTDFSGMGRFEGDEVIIVASTDEGWLAFGTRWDIHDGLASAEVYRTGRSARIDGEVGGAIGAARRRLGVVSTVASPITVAGKPWGALSLSSTRDPLPIDTEGRLEQFAALVATAIANAESREALARLADEQAALRRVATLVARDASSNEVFESVATEIGKLFDTDITIVGRYDDDGMATAIGNWSASPGGVPVGTRSAIGGRNVLTMVAETGKPARIDGYDDSSGEAGEIARRHGWRSSIAAPIVVEGRLWGVMLVATQRPDPFPLGAEERLAAFTDLVATALANAQAHDEVLRFGDEQAALGRVATLVAAGAAPERVFTAVVEEVSSLLELERIELVRYDGNATGTVIAACGDHPFPAGSTWSFDDPSVMATVARTRRAARIDDYSTLTGEIARAAHGAGFRSAIGAPITIEGRLWGVIIAISTDPDPIPERTEARLSQFTELVATAVANAEARHALERVAAEQATLRRIATLVANGVQPADVFTAVTEETAAIFRAITCVERFEHDPPGVILAGVSEETNLPVGTRWELAEALASAKVYRTGRSARLGSDFDWSSRGGPVAEEVRRLGIVSQVSCPIIVEGNLWGVITLNAREELPPDTEQRLEKFTELVTTAISNADSRVAIGRLADEQAALRRVATLVARGAPPEDIFAAAVNEVAGLLPVVSATMGRFEPDETVTTVASWNTAEAAFPTGRRWPTKGKNVAWMVLQTRRSARIDDFSDATDPIGAAAREAGYKSAVGSPIVVEGDLWGVMTATSSVGPLPPGTEARLASFTELAATAIANAEGKSELTASRRRIVAASDETRRRIEHDLHDGTQQRLVSLGLAVRAAEADLPREREDLRAELSAVAQGLTAAVEELQELSRGIHPAILSKGGLGPALQSLAHRSAIPVDLDVTTDVRLAEPIEVAAYFVASEALANATKHSEASRIDLSLAQRDGSLVLSVRDDGVGGADVGRGSGLVGLTDRVEALGGSIRVSSRPGEGTQITAELPLELNVPQAS
jgi:PAS domain S-box-containing protein